MTTSELSKDIHGWLLIDKPTGIGSTTVVSIIRKMTGIKKIGHGGTLDPDATGVLALALGEAAKTVQVLGDTLKTYRFTLRLGIATDTDDSSGNSIKQSSIRPETEDIKKTIEKLKGHILQLPPKLSALKINGKRAYELFHKGLDYELSPRKIYIQDITILERKNINEVAMEFTCGKGGYVRSLARDIGELLGCYGHAHGIRRIASGPFSIEKSTNLEELKSMPFLDLKRNILPIGLVLKEIPNYECNEEDIEKVLNGGACKIIERSDKIMTLAWIKFEDTPLAFGKVKDQKFFPTRVFNIFKR